MGILILAVSILPSLGMGANSLANAESSNQSIDRINSTIKDNVKNIYLIYVLFTIIETILLALGNMTLFDAFYFACGSMGNCVLQYNIGFSNHYSPYNEIIITLFCVIASLNFLAYPLLWKKRIKDFFKHTEIKTYLIMLVSAVAIVTLLLLINNTYSNPIDNIRYGLIQTMMFVSTGGYGATDYNVWPEATKWILIIAMFVGGCSSSTAGGLKAIRLAIVLQILRRNIFRRIHPRAIVAVKLGNETISANRAQNTLAFFLLYTMTFFISSMILSLDGQSFDTTATAILASLSNTGLAFNNASFTGDWSVFSQAGRLFLSLVMIVGRLEIFTILILLTPTFWRPNR
jgi:trk system potassium uptake protein TrkH